MNELIKTFQTLEIWKTGTPPADWASGPNSTAWAPMEASITWHVSTATSPPGRVAVYAQVVNLLNQAEREVATSRRLSLTERQQSGNFIAQLQSKYRPLAAA